MKLSRADLLAAAGIAKKMLVSVAGEDGKAPDAPSPLHTLAGAMMMSIGLLHIATNGKMPRVVIEKALAEVAAGVLDYTESERGREILDDTLKEKAEADVHE